MYDLSEILIHSVECRASDIHLSVGRAPNYRIDGVLHTEGEEKLKPDDVKNLIMPLLDERHKRELEESGQTDFAHAIPGVGRFRVNVFKQRGTLASVMRALPFEIPEPDMLGIPPEVVAVTEKKRGLVLVTGPTGSGKSTTLYTALSELNSEEVNIVTVEDPVEAALEGINQIQVNNKVQLTFAAALRSILRQDPDIIMIGEIRDSETASIAVQASITGHLVVSTLHTNSATGTLGRMVDMGVERYMLADSVVGVIAQRLVRRLCPHCRKKRLATLEEKKLMRLPQEKDVEIYEPGGCNLCNNTGYYGRKGIFEIMEVNEEIQRLIATGSDSKMLIEAARRNGMRTLRENGIRDVLDGVTSIEEMQKASYE